SSRRRHTRSKRDWSSDVCSSDLNFDNMTNINKVLREKLKQVAEIKAPEIAVEQRSFDGTIKWAMQVGDQQIESVYIPEADRATRSEERRVGTEWSTTNATKDRNG